PRIMGIVNVTPDSFSDGGCFFDPGAAAVHAQALVAAGADILDIGGESTRPGAEPVSEAEEIRRVVPAIRAIRALGDTPVSIDTMKPAVASAAMAAGAAIWNDVTALAFAPESLATAADLGCDVVLMHMRGEPRTMQREPFARNALRDVTSGFRRALAVARRAGMPKSQIVLDPGLGFGKSTAQNYELLAQLPQLARLGCPLLVGPSRKKFIGKVLGDAPSGERVWGTAATVAAAILAGAHIVRVHDLVEIVQVARVADAILDPRLAAKAARRA
ncbi:MAG: dihydropteroate synthase, partial [Acidobacteriota bacterium]|nr:dihydropteroate synthase [Acidobacteriota bacterium]